MTKFPLFLCAALVACLGACDAGIGSTNETQPAPGTVAAPLGHAKGGDDCCPMSQAAAAEKSAVAADALAADAAGECEMSKQCKMASKCEISEECKQDPTQCPKCTSGACEEPCEKPQVDE